MPLKDSEPGWQPAGPATLTRMGLHPGPRGSQHQVAQVRLLPRGHAGRKSRM